MLAPVVTRSAAPARAAAQVTAARGARLATALLLRDSSTPIAQRAKVWIAAAPAQAERLGSGRRDGRTLHARPHPSSANTQHTTAPAKNPATCVHGSPSTNAQSPHSALAIAMRSQTY